MMLKRRRGTWGGLTSTVIGELLGCSHTHAIVLLRKKRLELNRELTLNDIGNLIFEFRNPIKDSEIDRLLDRWSPRLEQ